MCVRYVSATETPFTPSTSSILHAVYQLLYLLQLDLHTNLYRNCLFPYLSYSILFWATENKLATTAIYRIVIAVMMNQESFCMEVKLQSPYKGETRPAARYPSTCQTLVVSTLPGLVHIWLYQSSSTETHQFVPHKETSVHAWCIPANTSRHHSYICTVHRNTAMLSSFRTK